MLRLIACDIDGTLIPYGTRELPEGVFPRIRRLRERGVLFCPASGRQYHSLRQLFAPVADELCFLCENGAAVYGPGPEETAPLLSRTVMPRGDALGLARAILSRPDAQVLISGANTSYVCRCSPTLRRDLEERLHNRVRAVDAPEEIGEEIIKVSAFCPAGTAAPEAALREPWGTRFSMAVAGPTWLDFTLADKGAGIRGLCDALQISLADVMAFGDNWNDLPMLERVGYPVWMRSAPAELLDRFPRRCDSVLEELDRLEKEAAL